MYEMVGDALQLRNANYIQANLQDRDVHDFKGAIRA